MNPGGCERLGWQMSYSTQHLLTVCNIWHANTHGLLVAKVCRCMEYDPKDNLTFLNKLLCILNSNTAFYNPVFNKKLGNLWACLPSLTFSAPYLPVSFIGKQSQAVVQFLPCDVYSIAIRKQQVEEKFKVLFFYNGKCIWKITFIPSNLNNQ